MDNLTMLWKKQGRLIIATSLVIIVALVLIVVFSLRASPKSPSISNGSSSTPTYDGSKPVPADSQARAKALGYYCPSWDTKGPGPAICYKIDQ